MNLKNISIRFRLLFAFLLLQAACNCFSQTIDFSGEEYDKNKNYLLKDGWEFYFNKLYVPGESLGDTPTVVSVPSSWKSYDVDGKKLPVTGYGSYRIKIKLPKNTPREFGIVTNRVKIAHSVYINGVKVGGDGLPTMYKETTKNSANLVISRVNLPEGVNEIEVVIAVSNFVYTRGGIDEIPYFAELDRVTAEKHNQELISAFIGGAFFLIGLYHFAIWYRRCVEYASLIFSIFCLTGSVRVFVSGAKVLLEFVPGLPSEILLSADFWTVFNAIPVMHLYVRYLFPSVFNWTIAKITMAVWFALMLVILFTPLGVQATVVPIFEIYVIFVFIHILYVGVKAVSQKLESSILFTFAFIIVVVTGINDILVDRNWLHSVFLFHFGILFFTFGQAVVLSERFTNVFVLLEQLNKTLEKQVDDRTKELRVSKERSDKLYEETKLLSSRLDGILEEERKTIAMLLHDSFGASLVGFRMKLSAIKDQVSKGQLAIESTVSTIEKMVDEVNGIYTKTRSIVKGLRPELIDVIGLKAALESLTSNYNISDDFHIYLTVEGELGNFREDVSISIFRICQEAITNIVKYAKATQVFIVLAVEGDWVNLTVIDNGIGFNTTEKSGIGLIGMREKTHKLKGVFTLESHPGQGTTISLKIPLTAS